MSVWYDIHLGKNISKFVFENSRFQIAEAFQSLFCDGRSAAVVNKSRTCGQRLRYRLYFFEINRKSATGNSAMFMLLHWYCHRGLGCAKMMKFTLKIFNISLTFAHATGPSQFVNAMQVHRLLWVKKYRTQVSDPFRSPLIGHQMTWSSQISVNTSCALSD